MTDGFVLNTVEFDVKHLVIGTHDYRIMKSVVPLQTTRAVRPSDVRRASFTITERRWAGFLSGAQLEL